MRQIMGFLILTSYLWVGTVWAQSPEALLDRLSQSQSRSVSAGLIAQIWARWTGAAADAEQQKLMQIGVSQMNAARYPQAEKTFDDKRPRQAQPVTYEHRAQCKFREV